MYVVLIRYTAPLEEVDRARDAHKSFLAECYRRGLFIVSGRQDPPVGGVILAEEMPREELEALLNEDGYAKAGVARHEVIRFDPVSHDPRFAPFMPAKS
jgi:uncharacterized protein YciI